MKNKFYTDLCNIESLIFSQLGQVSQKLIDTIQNLTIDIVTTFEDKTANDSKEEFVGAEIYNIEILLEIWDKDLLTDRKFLEQIKKVLENWALLLKQNRTH